MTMDTLLLCVIADEEMNSSAKFASPGIVQCLDNHGGAKASEMAAK
jgi:hypothetical protein